MNRWVRRAVALSLGCSLSGGALAASISSNGGLEVKSDDGNYTFALGGRLMWDTDSFDGALNRDHGGDRRWDSHLRRSRLEMSGTIHQHWKLKFDVDFIDGTSSAKTHTAGVQYVGFEALNIFVGRMKEPFGLEDLTSSKSLTSIERNYFTEATDADSQPHFGVRLDGMVGQVGWSLGVFNPNGNPSAEDGGDRLAVTGRAFVAPIQDDRRTLHLGVAATDRRIDTELSQNGFKLDIAESGGKLDSSSIVIEDDTQLALEGLYIDGPFSLQGEYAMKDMGGAGGGPDGEVRHAYLQASWTFTGERRGYKARDGVPDIIKPSGSNGALEGLVKLDRISFDVDGQPEEEVTGVLVGLNWYANRNIKFAINYVHVTSDNVTGAGEDDDADVISTRVQITF